MLTVLSLFAGIGGLDLGLERAGMQVVGQVEIDPYCQRVLAKHWPDIPRHDDVHTATGWWLSQERPRVDLICGGFPCQPVSLAGRQRGQDDERWLWPAMADVIRQLRPGWVLLENVPGLLVRGLGEVLGDLAACGYDAEWDCVPAAAVGAPHLRDRIWIVAYPNGERQLQPPGRVAHLGPGVGDRSALESPADTHGDEHEGSAPALRRPAAALVPTDADSPGRGPGCRLGWSRPPVERDGWWSAEPDVGRVAHGIPGRVDRLRALGNSVVPQVAEHVGRLIAAAHTQQEATR